MKELSRAEAMFIKMKYNEHALGRGAVHTTNNSHPDLVEWNCRKSSRRQVGPGHRLSCAVIRPGAAVWPPAKDDWYDCPSFGSTGVGLEREGEDHTLRILGTKKLGGQQVRK
jgi:hypothetical protein